MSFFLNHTHCFAPRDLLLFLVEKAGKTVPTIAQVLGVSPRTVAHWLQNENLKMSGKKYTKLLGYYCAIVMENP